GALRSALPWLVVGPPRGGVGASEADLRAPRTPPSSGRPVRSPAWARWGAFVGVAAPGVAAPGVAAPGVAAPGVAARLRRGSLAIACEPVRPCPCPRRRVADGRRPVRACVGPASGFADAHW